MKNNLFIICTPFHSLTAFILSKSIFKNDNNYLAIMHPQSYENWSEDPILKYISSTEGGFKAVFPLLRWFRSGQGGYRKQIDSVKEMMGNISFDKIFLGVDLDEQAQLLVAVLGKTEFYRFDEGIGSYSYDCHKRSCLKTLFHFMKIKYVCALAGIKTNLKFNTKALGASEAGVVDYLYRPELLMRPSPQALEITKNMINSAISDLKMDKIIKKQFDKPTVLYLSQPVKRTKKEEEDEIAFLRTQMASLDEKTQFLFKPHSMDNPKKILKYQKMIPNLKIYDSKIPAELLYVFEPNLQMVIAYHSSALLFGGKFTDRKIRMVSLARKNNNKAVLATISIMRKAGVEFIGDKVQ